MSNESNIRAFHIKKNIDIKQLKLSINQKPLSESGIELFYKLGEDCYLFVINYGAVVFYNCDETQIQKVLKMLIEQYGLNSDDFLSDNFSLRAVTDSGVVAEFNHIIMPSVDQDAIKISMLNMAQSIALLYYNNVSQELLTQVRTFTTSMEERGRLRINKRNIMRFIGKALNTQNRIAENLYIFDAPPITWENEYYETINAAMAKYFELNTRYRAIESTFKIIEANLHAFLELYHQKESSRLEWIIIILILVEVIDTFVAKLI